jgi:Mg2+/Co2+ transporter CorB
LSLGILDVLLLERLVAHGLVLAGGVLIFVLLLARVILALQLGAVGDEVVGVYAVEVALLLSTMSLVLVVVMEPLELVCYQHKLIIVRRLNLLLSGRHQRGQSKEKLGVSERSIETGHKSCGWHRWVLIWALDWRSILVDLSFLNSSSTVNPIVGGFSDYGNLYFLHLLI